MADTLNRVKAERGEGSPAQVSAVSLNLNLPALTDLMLTGCPRENTGPVDASTSRAETMSWFIKRLNRKCKQIQQSIKSFKKLKH